MAKASFGNRRAGILAHLRQPERLRLIAEGLPVIAASARSFWDSSRRLENGSREATVLEGFAEEEAAKALILMDMARCPAKQISRRAGTMVRTFYDHLGRLLYADAQHWRPTNIDQLREYVDHARQAHTLEGFAGEYIVPNWQRYSREAAMYADIEVYEDGFPQWSAPAGSLSKSIFGGPPNARSLVEAMAATGMFTHKGVRIINEVWGALDFVNVQQFDDGRRLTGVMFDRLDAAKLITEAATEEHGRVLYDNWQMPMYALEFNEIAVPLEELEARQEAALWSEIGY